MSVVKRTLSCLANELFQPLGYKDDEDWRSPVIDQLVWPISIIILELKYFVLIYDVLYYKSTSGVLVRCVSNNEEKTD